MQLTRPTFLPLTIVPERQYPDGGMVENELRVWEMSRWRGAREFATIFIRVGYRHLPPVSPLPFTFREAHMGGMSPIVHFTNPFDVFHLLVLAFFCGCEFIAFLAYNIFTNLDYTFPTKDNMHALSYHFSAEDDEE